MRLITQKYGILPIKAQVGLWVLTPRLMIGVCVCPHTHQSSLLLPVLFQN